MLLLVVSAACSQSPDPAPKLSTAGALPGRWQMQDFLVRNYRPDGTHVEDLTLPILPPYRYELLITETTCRLINYAGPTAFPDSAYRYTRTNNQVRVAAPNPEQWTVLELTDHKFTYQKRVVRASGSYSIEDHRFTR